ncbi:hypothetical protein [Streptomyces cavernicola]|uniref:Lipoprotein n=1 Tax=Streptomyces cavernicola TaxID=3043613 RepID=A0ABT6SAG1_9ACTN|nr:hypothetical protein [Streptomyces sp. B-S-A6]MDI3405181.1 hypothetical protein [Streptomyces sp. B-S-A6]
MALSTGCGGSGTAGGRVDDRADAGRSAKPQQALSPRQLDRLALTPADLPGHQVYGNPAGRVTDTGARHDADRRACDPIAGLLVNGLQPAPEALVAREVSPLDASGEVTGVSYDPTLSAYGGGRAAGRTVARLRTAVDDCRDGFAVKDQESAEGGTPEEYPQVRPLPAPKVGDEALVFRLTKGDGAPDGVPLRRETYTVVREGPLVVVFRAWHYAEERAYSTPDDVLHAQLAKLAGVGAARFDKEPG